MGNLTRIFRPRNLKALIPASLGGPLENVWNLLISNFDDISMPSNLFRNREYIWKWSMKHKPKHILEIGLGDGVNALAMMACSDNAQYYGFDNLKGNIMNRKAFELLRQKKNVHFYTGNSQEILPKVIHKLPKMDLIFIDGGHFYDECKSDWENCRKLMHPKTAVFFHDYFEDIGVKKTVDEIDNKKYLKQIIRPEVGQSIAMVTTRTLSRKRCRGSG